ncbi:MAG: YkgJ family cysteine cluster protein [Nitrospiraceae bacterium]|nr:YkgJ family cysteine cluster protein [Nitrospiraceae bacterium]
MYAPKDKKDIIVPVELGPDSTFTFACTREMPCFTRCCKNAHVTLTPFDIIRMKHRFGISSDEFLYKYTTLGHLEKTELPAPIIKMQENEEKSCPFLEDSGCSIYEDRPLTCRYYPIASGIFHNKDLARNKRFFALVKEDYCLGHKLGKKITIKDWRRDQGVIPYDEANLGWSELVLKRKSLGPFTEIPEKTLQIFFMACYNIDRFRRFVFDSMFLNVYVVPKERVKKISEDDFAMLSFAMDWLKTVLLGENKIKIRKQVNELDAIEVS